MIDRARLQTPRTPLGLLFEPDPAAQLNAAQAAHAHPPTADLLNTTIADLRAELRASLPLRGPVVATGHQVEFSHAGVWAKEVAVAALAEQLDGTPLHLIADSDTPKAPALKTFEYVDAELVKHLLTLPGLDLERSTEVQPRLETAAWRRVFAEAAERLPDASDTYLPLVRAVWDRHPAPQFDFTELMTAGRRAVENELGLGAIQQVCMSTLAQTRAFRSYAAYLLLNARPFAEAYNAAQQRYRQRHKLRNAARPVPALTIAGPRVGLPLWVLPPDGPRRHLYVRDDGDRIHLDGDGVCVGTLDKDLLADVDNHAAPWPIEEAGWRLRPRALILSSFARLFLADLFVHGIGGAKYDELTADFVQDCFQIAPAPDACVSATAYPPVETTGVTGAELRAAEHAARDVRFNPQRYLPEIPPRLRERRETLILRSKALRGQGPRYATMRREVFENIRATLSDILATAPQTVAALDERVTTLRAARQRDTQRLDREFWFALLPRPMLDELTARIRATVAAANADQPA